MFHEENIRVVANRDLGTCDFREDVGSNAKPYQEADEAPRGWCRQCARATGNLETLGETPKVKRLKKAFLTGAYCLGCGPTEVDGSGVCQGWRCWRPEHDQTPRLTKVWRWARQQFIDTIYWVECHTVHRRHLLDLRNDDYSYGYETPCQLMLYACFSLLREFVEDESALDRSAWSSTEERQQASQEMQALYDWWAHERFQEQVSEEKDEEMLARLMKVRPHLYLYRRTR